MEKEVNKLYLSRMDVCKCFLLINIQGQFKPFLLAPKICIFFSLVLPRILCTNATKKNCEFWHFPGIILQQEISHSLIFFARISRIFVGVFMNSPNAALHPMVSQMPKYIVSILESEIWRII